MLLDKVLSPLTCVATSFAAAQCPAEMGQSCSSLSLPLLSCLQGDKCQQHCRRGFSAKKTCGCGCTGPCSILRAGGQRVENQPSRPHEGSLTLGL